MTQSRCKKCGGRLVVESYPLEEMLVNKCFTCGKIDGYRELTRQEAKTIFRRVDRHLPAARLAS